MVLIHGTNIVVDDFRTHRANPKAYIYFLSHFHRGNLTSFSYHLYSKDCYQGISNLKGNERIYCSETTRKLLTRKFPHLKNVVCPFFLAFILIFKESLELETTSTIFIDLKKTIYIDVTFFDSNHCVGITSHFA